MANGYKTQFTSLEELLESQGYDSSMLQDPGALYGFGKGTDYGKFFRPFDTKGYNQAQSSLKNLEEALLTNVGQRFSEANTSLQSQIGDAIGKVVGQAGQSGFGGSGAQKRQKENIYETGMEQFQESARQTRAAYTGVQQEIGAKAGQLEGSLFDYLGGVSQTGLQITSMDPTGGNQGRLVTAEDIESFNAKLGMGDRMSFNASAQNLIGKDYQLLIDLFGGYGQNG